MRRFLSGNEAVAEGVRLSKPNVISAYPITPQTTVVEKLSEIVEQKQLDSRFVHVESEHSALSCAIGASAIGARTFTATSSQGLLYMAECLPYAAGGKFPIVMVNAGRSTALPWNIFGDQRDSLSQLDSGWIQVYVEDAQEALDTVIEAYYIAENKKVSTPVMINLDGFDLTHTYEPVDVPEDNDVDEFLPKFETENKFDVDHPRNLGFSVGPSDNLEWKTRENKAVLDSLEIIEESRAKFKKIFNRDHGGVIDSYKVEDADYVLISIGSISGLIRSVVDEFLPGFETKNKFDLNHPRNLGFSVGPSDNLEWKIRENKAVVDSLEIIEESRAKFKQIFNRDHGGVIDSYKVEDADYVLISIGSISGLIRSVVDELREQGEKVGYLKLRYIRPFPTEKLRTELQGAKRIGVLEKDISFGHFGTVYTNVKSVTDIDSQNFVGGLGGRNITRDNIKEIFQKLKQNGEELNFIGAKL